MEDISPLLTINFYIDLVFTARKCESGVIGLVQNWFWQSRPSTLFFRDHFANSFCVQVASMPEMHFSLLGFAHFLWAMNVGKRFVVCRV